MMETLGTIISWLLDFFETAGISENGHHTTARHPQTAIEGDTLSIDDCLVTIGCLANSQRQPAAVGIPSINYGGR
ncbi:MAG: hypothetical protein GXY41_07385 [Phycisphaerae bacterium]|nr:hypothetical protein [Phycisphaerae bacterium]